MTDTRRANTNWRITNDNVCWGAEQYDYMQLAVLMDIRTELQTLNRVFQCRNFLAIPRKLDRISKNTAKPRKRKAK